MITDTKVFDKKKYVLHDWYRSRQAADEIAEKLRQASLLARVVPVSDPWPGAGRIWVVYKRSKLLETLKDGFTYDAFETIIKGR